MTRRKTIAKAGQTRPKGKPARVLIVEARYYDEIADQLLAGASQALKEAGATFDVVTVPGSLEIPAAIAIVVDRVKPKYDGVVALGCVIQGDTFHFDVVAVQSARALMDISVARQLPVGNGILTVDTESQAQARAGLDEGNKGGEAAKAALALIGLKRSLGAA
jgi:6,7-dimethyl-8-ribityllumazine synthase